MNENEFQMVVLGALLHDIGRFWHRTGLMPDRSHPELSAMFVSEFLGNEWQDVSDLVANYHLHDLQSARNPVLTRMITPAADALIPSSLLFTTPKTSPISPLPIYRIMVT